VENKNIFGDFICHVGLKFIEFGDNFNKSVGDFNALNKVILKY
jgi:hypothetical protein